VYGVTVRHVVVSGAYRNSISVIVADGLLVEHSVFMNTRGIDRRGRHSIIDSLHHIKMT
jgi:hypothetical protein